MNQSSDLTANFFLLFCQIQSFCLVVAVGFLFINRPIFFQTACLSNLSILLNVALKGTFKVPMAIGLHKMGYAFPSGHMQMSTVFYVWLMLYYSSTYWRTLGVMLLSGIGYALIQFGYHDLNDVLGGISAALIFIIITRYALITWNSIFFQIMVCASAVVMVYNHCIYPTIPTYCWGAFALFISLLVFEKIESKMSGRDSYWQRYK